MYKSLIHCVVTLSVIMAPFLQLRHLISTISLQISPFRGAPASVNVFHEHDTDYTRTVPRLHLNTNYNSN